MNWNYDANDYNENSFVVIPEGIHRARISAAEETKFSTGREGIAITFDISGYSGKVFYNIVFMPEDRQQTNQKLGAIFNSFDIPAGNMNVSTWVGKVGAICIKHEDYNGEKQAKCRYCVNRSKQENLPAWKEPLSGGETAASAPAANTGFAPATTNPFA